jgi:hypothetical protein
MKRLLLIGNEKNYLKKEVILKQNAYPWKQKQAEYCLANSKIFYGIGKFIILKIPLSGQKLEILLQIEKMRSVVQMLFIKHTNTEDNSSCYIGVVGKTTRFYLKIYFLL